MTKLLLERTVEKRLILLEVVAVGDLFGLFNKDMSNGAHFRLVIEQ